MKIGVPVNERRQAKRVSVDSEGRIAKTVVARRDEVDFKNISHLGGYFEYSGRELLETEEILLITIKVPWSGRARHVNPGHSFSLNGFAIIMHVQSHSDPQFVGMGIKFLKPLIIS